MLAINLVINNLNYRNQETVLKEQIKRLSERIEYQENKLSTINRSIESKKEEFDRISEDLKRKNSGSTLKMYGSISG